MNHIIMEEHQEIGSQDYFRRHHGGGGGGGRGRSLVGKLTVLPFLWNRRDSNSGHSDCRIFEIELLLTHFDSRMTGIKLNAPIVSPPV